MKKIILVFSILIISCSKKEDLSPDFRNIVIYYQKKFPLKNHKCGMLTIYAAIFSKNNNDTIIEMLKIDSSNLKDTNGFYGIYEDDSIKKLVIIDGFKLSSGLVNNYKKEFSQDLIQISKCSVKEDVPLVIKYKLENKVPKFIRIDSVCCASRY